MLPSLYSLFIYFQRCCCGDYTLKCHWRGSSTTMNLDDYFKREKSQMTRMFYAEYM
jgi:hypothetical protein